MCLFNVTTFQCIPSCKPHESASLPEVKSVCGGGGSCAEHEPEGHGCSAPSATSHEEITSCWIADEVGFVVITCRCFYTLAINIAL